MTETSSGWTRRGFVGTTAAAVGAASLGIAPTASAKTATAASAASEDRLPAFPGAEGAGKWAVGGRGGSVYEVTTLADSGPGSLREGVSGSDRTIVFRVSGTIELQSQLLIAGNNLTIAGQTAPGGGICLSGHSTGIKGSAHDIVIRYLRFRLGDHFEIADDSFNTNVPGSVSPEIRNLIIDHCSFSWAVDECLSPYGNFDVTVQWCIVSEGLALSAHPKNRHGYGGIWGGERNTYHHNLIAHQGGRQPRFGYTEGINLEVDHYNNVVYDHGYTSVYGGEWSNGINIVGNYYKPGPTTLGEVAPVIVSANRGGQWYVAGNQVDGHPDVTAHNRRGIRYPIGGIVELAEPQPIPGRGDIQSAAKAYEAVLANAGAILPRRDAADARVVDEVRNGTGRLINSQKEVGGYPPLVQTEAPRGLRPRRHPGLVGEGARPGPQRSVRRPEDRAERLHLPGELPQLDRPRPGRQPGGADHQPDAQPDDPGPDRAHRDDRGGRRAGQGWRAGRRRVLRRRPVDRLGDHSAVPGAVEERC